MASDFSFLLARVGEAIHDPRIGIPFALLALASPIGAAAWLRRRALAAPARDVAAAWFGYARRAQWLVIGAWLAWIVALSLTGADRAAAPALRPRPAGWTPPSARGSECGSCACCRPRVAGWRTRSP